MSERKGLFNSKTAIAVLLFVLIFIWWGSARAESHVELGPSMVGEKFTESVVFSLHHRFANKFDLSFGYIGEQRLKICDRPDCEWQLNEQLYVGAELIVWDPWSGRCNVGIGPYYFSNADRAVTSKFRAGLKFECRLSDRWGLAARHWSAGDSNPDIELCNVLGQCLTNDWNTGQDSWMRLVWYFGK